MLHMILCKTRNGEGNRKRVFHSYRFAIQHARLPFRHRSKDSYALFLKQLSVMVYQFLLIDTRLLAQLLYIEEMNRNLHQLGYSDPEIIEAVRKALSDAGSNGESIHLPAEE